MPRKKKHTKPDPEERLAFDLKQWRDRWTNEPTIYEVGQRVQVGNIEKSVVTHVYDGGKILQLHEHTTERVDRETVPIERDRIVAWHDVMPYRSVEEQPPRISFDEKFQLTYSQRSLDSLFGTFYWFGCDLDPAYQRGDVWSHEDKIALIDSIFNNVDVGKFVLVKKKWKDNDTSYEILDGKQRMTAILEFYEGRFEYRGLKFRDMCSRDQHHFTNYVISWGELAEPSEQDKCEVFLRLNTSGKPQDPAHLEKVRKMLKSE